MVGLYVFCVLTIHCGIHHISQILLSFPLKQVKNHLIEMDAHVSQEISGNKWLHFKFY